MCFYKLRLTYNRVELCKHARVCRAYPIQLHVRRIRKEHKIPKSFLINVKGFKREHVWFSVRLSDFGSIYQILTQIFFLNTKN